MQTIVIHQAALGDFVLIWPLIRSLAPCGVVTHPSMTWLVEHCLGDLGVRGWSIESAYWNQLWRGEIQQGNKWGEGVPIPPRGLDAAQVTKVISFVAEPDSPWSRAAQQLFPAASLTFHTTKPPLRLTDPQWQPPRRPVTERPRVAVHAGSGGSSKRWPTEQTARFRDLLAKELPDVKLRLIAGRDDHEQWGRSESKAFLRGSGVFIETHEELMSLMNKVSAYVGFDSGPTHLAAQLGLPTVALFGPTDPAIWAPIGPATHVIAPGSEVDHATVANLRWITPQDAAARAAACLRSQLQAT